MKHRIRWTVLFGFDIIFIAITILAAELFYPSFGQSYSGRYFDGEEIVLILVAAIYMNHAFFGIHSIEFSESSIHLKGFHFRAAGNNPFHKKTVSIKYEDIYRIKAISLPVIGIIRVKFKANHFRKEFSFSCLYTKHKKLFIELSKNVKRANPDALINKKADIYTEL